MFSEFLCNIKNLLKAHTTLGFFQAAKTRRLRAQQDQELRLRAMRLPLRGKGLAQDPRAGKFSEFLP